MIVTANLIQPIFARATADAPCFFASDPSADFSPSVSAGLHDHKMRTTRASSLPRRLREGGGHRVSAVYREKCASGVCKVSVQEKILSGCRRGLSGAHNSRMDQAGFVAGCTRTHPAIHDSHPRNYRICVDVFFLSFPPPCLLVSFICGTYVTENLRSLASLRCE